MLFAGVVFSLNLEFQCMHSFFLHNNLHSHTRKFMRLFDHETDKKTYLPYEKQLESLQVANMY